VCRGAGKVEEDEGEGLAEEEKDARRQELNEILESPTLKVYFDKYLKVCGPRTFKYLKSSENFQNFCLLFYSIDFKALFTPL
jgi:hypothetical protein